MKRALPVLLLTVLGSLSAFAGDDLKTAQAAGWGPFLLWCVGGGLLSLITPCVFPMIPVTVSYFSKRSTLKPYLGAGSYAAGIISMFTVIGIVVTLVFGATGLGNFASNPWVNVALGLLFVVLALNLFGLFEIQVPTFITNKLAGNTRKEGLAGPFFMGATFSLTSFTCTMPVAGSLLAQAATGKLLFPVVGMFTYSATFAAPFFILAMFPTLLSRTPKAGDWLNVVKPALAFVELAAAVKFFANADATLSWGVLTRSVVAVIWAVIFAGLALYLMGVPKQISSAGWVRRGLGAGAAVLCGILVLAARGQAFGTLESFFPQIPEKVLPSNYEAVDYKDALEKAKKAGRPIFIDFTGVNCTNCRFMEKNIFPKAKVKEQLEAMVSVHLYTDRPTDSDRFNQNLQTKLSGDNSLPTYMILTPDGKVIDKFEGATNNDAEFASFLNKAKKI